MPNLYYGDRGKPQGAVRTNTVKILLRLEERKSTSFLWLSNLFFDKLSFLKDMIFIFYEQIFQQKKHKIFLFIASTFSPIK